MIQTTNKRKKSCFRLFVVWDNRQTNVKNEKIFFANENTKIKISKKDINKEK